MTLDLYITTLGHLHIQRHLFAVGPRDLVTMIRAGNEFLQLQPNPSRGRYQVQTVDEQEMEAAVQVQPVNLSEDDTANLSMAEMMKVLQTLATQLQGSDKTSKSPPRKRPPVCWDCGVTGHVRQECPAATTKKPSGNAYSPQE